ncbi:MAG: DUF5687 family protein [Salinivirgaceae bacterium]|jgi:hypothetical protein|nr:hypothetical protein [Bacteroidales bacterium]
MFLKLLRHNWLKGVRSPGFYKNLAMNIFIGLVAIYFLSIFVILGFLLPQILQEIAPETSPVHAFNGILVFVVPIILFIRFWFQPLSSINIQSYQLYPIKRSILINYLLIKPLLNPVNYISLCFAIPFALSGVAPILGNDTAFRFVLITIFLIWFNTLFASFLKRKYGANIVGILAFIAILLGLGALEIFKIFSLFTVSAQVFNFLIENTLGWILVLIFSSLAYFANRWFFKQNYYPETFEKKTKKENIEKQHFSFMERFGKIGNLLSLQIKLILRHKRVRNALYMGIFFLFYGFIFYPFDMYRKPGYLMFVAIFITAIGMIMFGQWIINWDGAHFDFLMTRKISTQTYIRSNYYLLLSLSVISFILTTPYFFFGKEIIIYHCVAILYNIGVNIHVYLFGATYNTKRLELAQGSVMNMQGVSIKNFIVLIPLLVVPMLIIGIFSLFSATNIALIILASIGLLGIIFTKQLLKVTEKQFLERKYALCDGFRKKE